jgi:tRNA (guanine-N7-)-methyltransferase
MKSRNQIPPCEHNESSLQSLPMKQMKKNTHLSTHADGHYQIMTAQTTAHESLDALVKKHRTTSFLRPIADHQITLFENIDRIVRQQNRPIILDSGCGTGMSTVMLAKQYPDCLLIGLDKSLARLKKSPVFGVADSDMNLHLIRANVLDFWRLALSANWPIQQHYLLYPNPYPKKNDITKRWHGHPIFPTLMALSPHTEIRSNWRLYLEEYQQAAQQFEEIQSTLSPFLTKQPMTAFEKKYIETKTPLFSLEIRA